MPDFSIRFCWRGRSQGPHLVSDKSTSVLVKLRPRHSFKSKTEFHNACATCPTVQRETRCALACCRMFLITLSQEDLDAGLAPLPPFVDVLNKRPDGSCASLDEETQLCTNWETRPLECRTYDCREDKRGITANLNVQTEAFVLWPAPGDVTACPDCDEPLRLLGGCKSACDDHALCATCFAPFHFTFDYRGAAFRITPALDVSDDKREAYALAALVYLERFDAVIAAVDERRKRRRLKDEEFRANATAHVERSQFDAAHQALDALEERGQDVVLDRVVVHLRSGNFAAATALLDDNLDTLAFDASAIGHYYAGRAARLGQDRPKAAQEFLLGLLAAQASGASLTIFKEQLFEMEAEESDGGPVHAILEQAAAFVPTLRD